jgi:putative phage-type endonuclease
MEQGTDAWFQARIGKVTASRVTNIMAKTKSGYSTSRQNYMMELLCQRLTGAREEGFTNAAMQRGIDMEPIARGRYEIESDVIVAEIGLVDHPSIENFAASPDGLVGDKGMLEIKCPNTATHIDFIKSGKIPSKYQTQMTVQMMCAERDWCDFVSFDDRLPENLQYKCVRFNLDAQKSEETLIEVKSFLAELNALVKELQEQET